jgi:hypothetical protein
MKALCQLFAVLSAASLVYGCRTRVARQLEIPVEGIVRITGTVRECYFEGRTPKTSTYWTVDTVDDHVIAELAEYVRRLSLCESEAPVVITHTWTYFDGELHFSDSTKWKLRINSSGYTEVYVDGRRYSSADRRILMNQLRALLKPIQVLEKEVSP